MADTSEDRRATWAGLPSWSQVRATAGLLAGALVAVVGALVLGEHRFEGWLPAVAGVLLGLVVAEVVVAVGGRRGAGVAVAGAAMAAASAWWAGWISSGRGLEPFPAAGWLAVALAAVAAAWRGWAPHPRRPLRGR